MEEDLEERQHEEEDEIVSESNGTDEESSDDDDEEEEEEDDGEAETNEVDTPTALWDVIKSEAWTDNLQSIYDMRRQELENAGLAVNQARYLAAQFMKPMIQDNVRSLLMERIEDMRELRQDPLYRKIKETKKRLREEDEESFSHEESWHCAIKKRQYLVDKAIGILKHVNIDEFYENADEAEEDVEEESVQ